MSSFARSSLQFGFVLVSLSASLILSFHSIVDFKLPGCGVESSCEALSASRWGSLFGVSTAHLGAAWFAGMLALWFLTRNIRGENRVAAVAFRWLVRFGFAMSVFFVAIILIEQKLCPWCIVVHSANALFWAVTEFGGVPDRGAGERPAWFRPVFASGLIGVLSLAGLVSAENMRRSALEAEARFTLEASVDRIVARSLKPSASVPPGAREKPITGRYRKGSEQAELRLVVFTGYQCKECQKMEPVIEEYFETAPEGTISVIHKHFPLSNLCNPNIPSVFHENACNAAYAAEAAGVLGGKEGFLRMHQWLMERAGAFTADELRAALPTLGFADVALFEKTMRDPKVRATVRAEIEEGVDLGLNSTPIVYINGELLVGARSENLMGALESIRAAGDLPVTGAQFDRPLQGMEKLVREWRDGEVAPFPHESDPARFTMGPEDAEHRVVVTLSYQSPTMPELDETVRDLVESRDDIHVELRHFPFSKKHNPRFAQLDEERYPQDWDLALAVEAVTQLGGEDAFWKIHSWLLEQSLPLSDVETVVGSFVRETLGLDEGDFRNRMSSSSVEEAIRRDMAFVATAGDQARAAGVYLNGRRAPTWRPPGKPLWEAMLKTAP